MAGGGVARGGERLVRGTERIGLEHSDRGAPPREVVRSSLVKVRWRRKTALGFGDECQIVEAWIE